MAKMTKTELRALIKEVVVEVMADAFSSGQPSVKKESVARQSAQHQAPVPQVNAEAKKLLEAAQGLVNPVMRDIFADTAINAQEEASKEVGVPLDPFQTDRMAKLAFAGSQNKLDVSHIVNDAPDNYAGFDPFAMGTRRK